jgi:hypothetical protein
MTNKAPGLTGQQRCSNVGGVVSGGGNTSSVSREVCRELETSDGEKSR